MSRTLTERIEAAFGVAGFPRPLFYAFDNALRFELGDGADGVAGRFMQASVRARTIAATAFAGSESLSAITCSFWGPSQEARIIRARRTLKKLGFGAAFVDDEPTAVNDQDPLKTIGEDCYFRWSMAEFQNAPSAIDALLWVAIGAEMAVRPAAAWVGLIYIVDFEKRIALHAYDDRGMDVVAMDAGAIRPLYDRFGSWLLDYDRVRMDRRFATD